MNENISTKDLLNLILGNQETPKITENKEMELEQAISYLIIPDFLSQYFA